jgi:uroporphyrinogen III methyltransferase/synthase
LGRADVVLYDYLVNPRALRHAGAAAECICLGQHGQSRIWTQQEINERMIALARSGRTVVRLKGGDPTVFARAVDEIAALVEAGIAFEIVPGVTASIAVGSYAGIPLTHRDHASAVAFVTGQEDSEKRAAPIDYAALAGFPGTLVFYMGVTTSRQWSSQLLAAGKPPDTPVAIVRRCSFPDQRVVRCTLAEVAARVDGPPRIRPPAIMVVGTVVNAASSPSWFQQRPLCGARVLVTRPRDQAGKLVDLLEEQGAEVLLHPAIEIDAPDDWGPVDRVLARLAEFDWIAFSSANGVAWFFRRLLETGRDARALGRLKLAAIGPGTADALADFQLRTDLVPDSFRAESLAEALSRQAAGRRVLLARASRGREIVADQLRDAGACVEQIVVYHSTDVPQPDARIAALLSEGAIDWVTVTSSAIAHSLVRLFGDALRRSRLASLSPVTSETLSTLGFPPAAEADRYTMSGLVESIIRRKAS